MAVSAERNSTASSGAGTSAPLPILRHKLHFAGSEFFTPAVIASQIPALTSSGVVQC
jgi:hypothetical protein